MPRHRLTVILVALLLVALSGCARPWSSTHRLTHPASARPVAVPVGDVYAAPGALPPGEPGALLRMQPVSGTSGAATTLVQYRSRDAAGHDVPVTGTVLVPQAKWLGRGPRPWVAYAPFTRGVDPRCAPSRSLATNSDIEIGAIGALLARGYGVAVTDYDGYTDGGRPSYAIGPAMAHAVLDLARAAGSVPGTGIDTNSPWVVAGYSQGGAGSAWAASAQPSYAPDVHLVAAVAGGVPADPLVVGDGLDGGPGAGLLLIALVGLDRAFPDIGLRSKLDDTGRADADRLAATCITEPAFRSVAGVRVSDITVGHRSYDDLAREPAIRAAADVSNLVAAPAPRVPVYQFHATGDEVVPFPVAQDLHRTWCAAGAAATLETVPGGHLEGAASGAPAAGGWLDGVFNGRRVPPGCTG